MAKKKAKKTKKARKSQASGRPKRPKKKLTKPPPTCKAILLCDAIILDALTGKLTLVGIFEHFNLQSLPGKTVPAQVFLQLTNAKGKYNIGIEVHDLKNDAIIARGIAGKVELPDRLAKLNAWFPLPALPIKQEGTYDLVVSSGDAEIDRQQFQVKLFVPPSRKGE